MKERCLSREYVLSLSKDAFYSLANRASLTTSYTHRLSHIPLTLLYSSLTKLFLLLLLSLWKPSSAPSSGDVSGTHISSFASIEAARAALQVLDDDKLDREWVVRNVLGGMAAGFGLRGKRIAFVSKSLHLILTY